MFKFWKKFLTHKYYFWKYGGLLGVGLFERIFHDCSKLTPQEFWVYARDKDEDFSKEDIERATIFHAHRNPHHWQFWVSYDKWGTRITPLIPDKYLRQMVADWFAVAKGQYKEESPETWEFYKSIDSFPINSLSKSKLRQLIHQYWDEDNA